MLCPMLGAVHHPYSGTLQGPCDDTALPEGLTSEELKDYAKRCGKDAAMAYVKEQTGVDVSACVSSDGSDVDWTCAAKQGIGAYTGIPVDDLDIFDEDGNIDFEASFRLAGEIAAVAVCTAYGAGAAAPICGAIGGRIGGIVYSIAQEATETFTEIFGGGKEPRIYQPDAFNCSIQAQRAFAGAFDGTPQMNPGVSLKKYTSRLLTLRSLMVATLDTLDRLERNWPALAGQQATKAEIYEKLTANGLQMPRMLWDKWRYLFAADADGAWFDGTSAPNTRYRVSRSVLAFVNTLMPRRPPLQWDIWVTPGAETSEQNTPKLTTLLSLLTVDQMLANRYRYKLGGATECRAPSLSPLDIVAAQQGVVLNASPCPALVTEEQYDAFQLAGGNFNSNSPSAHWLIVCGGDPVGLKAIEWSNVTVYDAFQGSIARSYDPETGVRVGGMRAPISGHTVLHIASNIDIDYWCLLASDNLFETMKTVWIKSLDASVKRTLAQARAQRSQISGRMIAPIFFRPKLAATAPAGPGAGAWAVALGGLAAVVGGAAWWLRKRGGVEVTWRA